MEQLKPYFVAKPWGGDFISQHFNLPEEKLGEAFILSTLKDQESTVSGKPLSSVLGGELPYLIKIIDAIAPLSIQVHPNDKWARELESSRGKAECWVIISAKPNAGVYLGLKPGVSEENFRTTLASGAAVDELMSFYPVRPGDFIFVPPGCIHAIGAGITIMEIQQSSGITYRLWDWGRTDRELHIDKGLKVSDFETLPGILTNVFDESAPRLLLKHPDFEVNLNQIDGPGWYLDLDTLGVQNTSSGPAPKRYLFVK